MMKKISWLLTVLVALPLGIAAHEAQPPDKAGTESPDHNQHQKYPTKGEQMHRDAVHDDTDAGEPTKVLEFKIVRGALGDGEQTIRVTEGDIVELRWSSDQELDLHMHGYNLEINVAPHSHATMRINAVKTGRFAVLNHDGEPPNVLLYLEVLPK